MKHRRKGSPQRKPEAGRPDIPGYGIAKSKRGLLRWNWARTRLTRAHNYWIATVNHGGGAHLMPVWGVWMDEAFWFSTGRKTRKARNLGRESRCVIAPEGAREAVIVEGVARRNRDAGMRRKFNRAYQKKYKWDMADDPNPVFRVRPRLAFAFIEKASLFTSTATRWRFQG
jgi:hypothetical protein